MSPFLVSWSWYGQSVYGHSGLFFGLYCIMLMSFFTNARFLILSILSLRIYR